MQQRMIFLSVLILPIVCSADEPSATNLNKPFRWTMSEPLIAAKPTGGMNWHAIKDPTIVRHQEQWHLFATMRGTDRSHTIVYLTFAEWQDANSADRHLLTCHDGFFCAPQVFWFSPHGKWYLICQAANESWGEPPYRPAFTTTETIDDPASWAPLSPMFDHKPDNIPGWLDFWVICDQSHAWLFFTSLNGRMWRSSTSLPDFPKGWSQPELALQGDVFEASHTYRIAGSERYLTLIEAQNGHGWRYFKAYTASSLGGEWTPLADTKDDAFASMQNVVHPAVRWSDSISHGELLRSGSDEKLEIHRDDLRFLFQGVLDRERIGGNYGAIPWRLGLLTPSPGN